MARTIICPPQSAPPLSDLPSLFSRLWWLFFQQLANAILPNNELTIVPSGDLTPLTASYVDVPGLALTLNQDGVWRVGLVLDINSQAAASGVFAQLVVNGVAQSRVLHLASAADFSGVVYQVWYIPMSGQVDIKVQTKVGVASGVREVLAANTLLEAVFLHQ